MNFTVPEKFIGYNVNELKLDSEFGLKLLALKRAETLKNCLGISFTEHDVVNELPDDDRIQACLLYTSKHPVRSAQKS